MTIGEIFSRETERFFRQLEIGILEKTVKSALPSSPIFISLGAGFEGELPREWTKVWLRRNSDSKGRIFLNRPKLSHRPPIEDYMARFDKREERYILLADMVLTLREGSSEADVFRLAPYFFKAGKSLPYFLTLQPWMVANKEKCERVFAQLLHYGFQHFELRTDLIDEKHLPWLQKAGVNFRKCLLSFRSRDSFLAEKSEFGWRDWEVGLGDPPFRAEVLSTHRRVQSLKDTLAEIESYEPHCDVLKVALNMDDMAELKTFHLWREKNPKRLALPMSKDGRWYWYRLLNFYRDPLKFVRVDQGVAFDQPTFLEALQGASFDNQKIESFAAVLGDPVLHSHSPTEHHVFFEKRNKPFWSVTLGESEMSRESLNFLNQLGLECAAVTSPLKIKAGEVCSTETPLNTLAFDEAKSSWQGANTDLLGLKSLESYVNEPLAVWGGGGMAPTLKEVFPQASFFKARSQALVNGDSLKSSGPRTLIWAVGRSRMRTGARFPHGDWRPEVVIDLNYAEDSPGREYAQMTGARYISGEEMFKVQAKAQREFWEKYVGK